MNVRSVAIGIFFLLVASVPGFAQQTSNGNFDWRDATSNALQEIDRHIESTTNLPKYKSNRFGIKTKNQILKSWRNAGNSIRRKAAYITKTYGRSLGWGAFLADGPAKAMGHWSAGQYEDGSVELANEGVKTFATLGGAYVGAGGVLAGMKIMGIGGMTIGGPVGGIVGAAIGGAIGAIGGGIIYDGYASGYVQQVARGTIDVGRSTVRDIFSLPDEQTPFEEALNTKHDFLVRQVVEQRERELRQMYGYEGTDEEEVLLTDRMLDPKKILGDDQTNATKPVIPDACTLTMTIVPTSTPENKVHWTLRVENGVVTGTAKTLTPDEMMSHVMNYRDRLSLTGKIQDNQISGTESGSAQWQVQLRDGKTVSHSSRWNGKFEMLLNLNGTVRGTTVIRGSSEGTAWGPDTHSFKGRWQIGTDQSK